MTNNIFDKYNLDRDILVREARAIAASTCPIIMDIFNQAAHNKDALGLETKDDNSPVTIADHRASAHIVSQLTALTPHIAVVSEENDVNLDPSQPYWSVDPLDGTKIFASGRKGFAVNIALMLDGMPALGVVSCPAHGTSYFSAQGMKSYKVTPEGQVQEIAVRAPQSDSLSVYFDKAHAKIETYERAVQGLAPALILPEQPNVERQFPHNLMVAEGTSDIHVKTGKDITFNASSGRSWDNAADYIILKNAGGTMVRLNSDDDGNVTVSPLKFDTVRDRMPAYMSGNRGLIETAFPHLRL
jgi:3'(2'), 5'-bisphosphate nucleotidase